MPSSVGYNPLTNKSPQGSDHEDALGCQYDLGPAHGALAQQLGMMAVVANDVATGHQDHDWAVLVTNGTCGGGLTRGGTVLLFAASLSICSPRGGDTTC